MLPRRGGSRFDLRFPMLPRRRGGRFGPRLPMLPRRGGGRFGPRLPMLPRRGGGRFGPRLPVLPHRGRGCIDPRFPKLLRRGEIRLDPRRGGLDPEGLSPLRPESWHPDRGLPFPACPAAFHQLPAPAQRTHRPAHPGEGDAPGEVHHREPGHPGEQREPGQEQGEQEDGRPDGVERTGEILSQQVADDAAGVERQIRAPVAVQRCQPASGAERHDAPGAARHPVDEVQGFFTVVESPEDQPPGACDHDGEEVGHVSEEMEQDGRPATHRPLHPD